MLWLVRAFLPHVSWEVIALLATLPIDDDYRGGGARASSPVSGGICRADYCRALGKVKKRPPGGGFFMMQWCCLVELLFFGRAGERALTDDEPPG